MSLASEFDAEMGTNPLGDREALKSVGGWVVEFYVRPLGHYRRVEQGETPPGVVQVFEQDPDHWRPWKRIAYVWLPDVDDARTLAASITGTDDLDTLRSRAEDFDGVRIDTDPL